MRRFICIVSAFTLLLAGCVKNEPLTSGGQEPKAEIAFESPIVAPKAKSVQEIASGFPTTLDMKVWGFYSETQYPAVDATNHTVGSHNYMLGALYENDENKGAVWGCSEKGYYWPHSGYLHFVAFAPAAPAGGLTASAVTDEGLQLTGYTVPDEADEDLLVSQVAYSQTKPANPEDGAPILFDHALTSVVFNVKSGVYGDRSGSDQSRIDTDIRIVKIEVIDARATGDFSQQMTSWNNEQMAAASTEKGWTVADNALTKDFTAYDGTAYDGLLLTDAYQSVHDLANAEDGYSLTNLILLPQQLKDNVILKVTYDMTYTGLAELNGVGELWIEDQVVQLQLNQCDIKEWLRGYRYSYNLTIELNRIICSTEVAQWSDEDDASGEIESPDDVSGKDESGDFGTDSSFNN